MSRRSTRLQQRDVVEDTAAEINDSDYEETVASIRWKKCQTCGKWRKLSEKPAVNETINQSTDETDFVCSSNTWAPEHADCSAPEESGHWNDVWSGMPEAFGKGPSREHFYQVVIKAGFPNGRVNEPFPVLYNQPIDLYKLYVVVESIGGRDKLTRGLDSWLPVGKLMKFPETDTVATRLRQLHTRFIMPAIKYATDKNEPLHADFEEFELENPNGPAPKVKEKESKKTNARSRWSEAEDAALKAAVAELGHGKWTMIALSHKWGPLLAAHSVDDIRGRYRTMAVKEGPTLRSSAYRSQNQQFQRAQPLHAPTAYFIRRPYPVKLFDMPIHRKAARILPPGKVPADDESEDSGAESDDETSPVMKLPHFQYYASHKQELIQLSDVLSVPMRSLRQHLVAMLHFNVDSAVQLLQSLSQETDTTSRAALLSDAILKHYMSIDRKGPLKAMSDASNQTIKAERKRRFEQTMTSFDASKRQKLEQQQKQQQDQKQQQQQQPPSVSQPQLPEHQQTIKQDQTAYPTSSANSVANSTPSDQPPQQSTQPVQTVQPTQPVLPTQPTQLQSPNGVSSAHPISNGVSPYARSPPIQQPITMQQPGARRIYRLPSHPSPPASNGASPVGRVNPLAAHRPIVQPLLTTKRRLALEAAAAQLQNAVRSGLVVQDITLTAPIDDSDSVLGAQKVIIDMLPLQSLLHYTPSGVRVSSLVSLIDLEAM